ncbi:MAG: MaoC family dehydratase N-terminal domain-containing protein [Mesorhizobium sp.]
MSEAGDYAAWIGKQETSTDEARQSDLARFEAMFGTLSASPPAELPPLAHWMLFPAIAAQADLGDDGHPKRGGFLPAVDHLPRRMWTGGRLSFHGAIPVGAALQRTSTVLSIKPKTGGSGELVFVTVRHEITDMGGTLLIDEEQDIVYRGMGTANAPPAADLEGAVATRTVTPDATLLFRYSAATFNGHRIHYDRTYATAVEGYPGLVVHGPLTATLLLNLGIGAAAGERPVTFSFRAQSPAIDGNPLALRAAERAADGSMTCWASTGEGHAVMTAQIGFRAA